MRMQVLARSSKSHGSDLPKLSGGSLARPRLLAPSQNSLRWVLGASSHRHPMNIEKYKRDHVEIMRRVTDLKRLVLSNVAAHAAEIAREIVAISSTIKLHLAIEDQVLYPTMKKSTDPGVAQTASRFQDEMGPLAADFAAFARRWNTERSVASDAATMRDQAIQMLDRIHHRMHHENRELYPLAERV